MQVEKHTNTYEFWGATITDVGYELIEDRPGEIKDKIRDLVKESFESGEAIPLFYEIEVEGQSFYLYPEDEMSYREYKELLENTYEKTTTNH